MALPSLSQRECLKAGWRAWNCNRSCPVACKTSSYRFVIEMTKADDLEREAARIADAQAKQNYQVTTEYGVAIADENGNLLDWPKGIA